MSKLTPLFGFEYESNWDLVVGATVSIVLLVIMLVALGMTA